MWILSRRTFSAPPSLSRRVSSPPSSTRTSRAPPAFRLLPPSCAARPAFAFTGFGATTMVTWFDRLRIRNARPIGAGSTRFCIMPESTYASFTTMPAASSRPASSLFCRFETADRRTFSATRDACLGEKWRMCNASSTDLPRMRSITSRILRGEVLMYRLMARASMDAYPAFDVSSFLTPGCPRNNRVGENSPSLWPTIPS